MRKLLVFVLPPLAVVVFWGLASVLWPARAPARIVGRASAPARPSGEAKMPRPPLPRPTSADTEPAEHPDSRDIAATPPSEMTPEQLIEATSNLVPMDRPTPLETEGWEGQLFRAVEEQPPDERRAARTLEFLDEQFARLSLSPLEQFVRCSSDLCRVRLRFDSLDKLYAANAVEAPDGLEVMMVHPQRFGPLVDISIYVADEGAMRRILGGDEEG